MYSIYKEQPAFKKFISRQSKRPKRTAATSLALILSMSLVFVAFHNVTHSKVSISYSSSSKLLEDQTTSALGAGSIKTTKTSLGLNGTGAGSSGSSYKSSTKLAATLAGGTSTSQTTSTTPLGQSGSWNLAFDDEFNTSSLDLTKWIMCNPSYDPQSQCLPYNDEQEIYNTTLPSNANVNVSGGDLNLTATKQNNQIYSGVTSTGPNEFGYNQPGYTGFQFTYGYVEVSAKLPKGDGLWPSVWLLPDENKYGAWPGSGEYDIFETAGNDPSTDYMSEHDGQNGSTGDQAIAQVADTSAGYHVYGFDWEPDHLAWYVDGKLARTMICTNAYATAHPGVCDSYRNLAAIKNYPFFLIMNLAVGGDWTALDGGPDSSTPFPSTMSINWIHVWQHPAS